MLSKQLSSPLEQEQKAKAALAPATPTHSGHRTCATFSTRINKAPNSGISSPLECEDLPKSARRISSCAHPKSLNTPPTQKTTPYELRRAGSDLRATVPKHKEVPYACLFRPAYDSHACVGNQEHNFPRNFLCSGATDLVCSVSQLHTD